MRVRGLDRASAERTAMQYLEKVRIPDQAGKYPSQLSGGQQQRVAIARAQEGLQARRARVVEQFVRRALLHDLALVHEDQALSLIHI